MGLAGVRKEIWFQRKLMNKIVYLICCGIKKYTQVLRSGGERFGVATKLHEDADEGWCRF